MAQSSARPNLDDGARVASWRLCLLHDVCALMPDDQIAAAAMLDALAIRMSMRYDPPLLRERKPPDAATLPTVQGVGHC